MDRIRIQTAERKPVILPLPGRPCAPRWLLPHLPPGWTVRSDGTFFYVVQGDRLRAMFDVFAARDLTADGIRQAVALATQAEPDQEMAEDEEQRMRLGAAIVRILHGMPNHIVLAALTDIISSTLAGTSNELPGQVHNMKVFIQQLVFHFSSKVGISVDVVHLDALPPKPPQRKTH